ncbi:MAG TPA: DUF6159 family protein [Thermoleophilaceae bacterium]|jgi:hypothetical protein
MQGGRIARGWALTKETWAVVRRDRSLILFPTVAGVCALVAAAVFFGAGAGIGSASDSFWPAVPFIVVGAYLIIAIGQFCAVALAACATRALDGADTTFSEGVAAARGRLGIILRWSAVQLVVGAAITALQALLRESAGSIVSSIFGGLANFAWTVATFFVVPVIAFEGLGPKEAIARSTAIIRERWGESVVGSATIGGALFLIGILPGVGLVVAGAALTGSSAGLGAVVIAVGVVVVVIAGLLQVTLSAVFRVVLYRFATTGQALGPFGQEQLAQAFRPKGRSVAGV